MELILYILSRILLLLAILFNYGLMIIEDEIIDIETKLWINTLVLFTIILTSMYIGAL